MKIVGFLLSLSILLGSCCNFQDKQFDVFAIENNILDIENASIIFLGENHAIINEERFLAENIDYFYQHGVRYFFTEADFPEFVPGDDEYFFYMFYPWMGAGWRFENLESYLKILDYNKTLPEGHEIVFLAPEKNRIPYDSYDPTDNIEFINYRDQYAFDTIKPIITSMKENEKALIYYGSGHGVLQRSLNKGPDGWFIRKPLGFLLNNQFPGDIISYKWYTNNSFFGSSSLDSNLWEKTINDNRYFLPENEIKIFGLKRNVKGFSGLILEDLDLGLPYQYVPIAENIEYIIKMLRSVELDWDNFNNDSYLITDPKGQYVMGIYYLKLYFGSDFDYNFWREEKDEQNNTLIRALDALEEKIGSGYSSPIVQKMLQNRDLLYDYQKALVYANILDYLYHYEPDSIIGYCKEAMDLFPEDIWPLYWIAFVYTTQEEYELGLLYWDKLINSSLAYSIESLPLALKMAADCASNVGKNTYSQTLLKRSELLENEHGINVDGFFYSGNLYYE